MADSTAYARYSGFGGGGASPQTLVGAGGEVTIASGASSKAVTFSTAFVDTTYAVVWSIKNTTDVSPIFLQGVITAKATTGFTVTFNTPTDTANYALDYLAAGAV